MTAIDTHLLRSSAHISVKLRKLVKDELTMIGIGRGFE
jgi:hypothetical protein